jgi:two-component system chemotaxis sensor kinase CheA
VDFSEHSIVNRELSAEEPKTHHYRIAIDKKAFDEAKKGSSTNWYLMIEKPDAQYIEVSLNDQEVGSVGDEAGKAHLWNGTFFIKFNQRLFQETNNLEIAMYSDYTTGVGGKILVLNHEDYKEISRWIEFSNYLLSGSSILTFFAAVLLCLIILAWHQQLYNIRAYIYFFVALILLGISAFEYQVFEYISMSYITFKKIIAISLHGGIAFLLLAISTLLNTRIKFNFAMINFGLIIFYSLTIDNMIDLRNSYVLLNVFILGAVVQLIVTLFKYRKRAPINISVMLVGFILCGLSVAKLVYLSNAMMSGSMLIDIPIITTIMVSIVLFLFYLEMVQMVHGHDVAFVESDAFHGVNSYMQGSFTIDKSYTVVGAYSTSCDHIFNQLIVGKDIESLFNCEKRQEELPIKDVLINIFNEHIDFKEGFIALLPERLTLSGRDYQINYQVIEKAEILLRITCTDISKNVQLEKIIKAQEQDYALMLNTLKSKNEVSHLIQRTRTYLARTKQEGFTDMNRQELHTLKGNLGQIGFSEFEQSVHFVEDQLEGTRYDTDQLIQLLEEGLNNSLDWIDIHIGRDYFVQAHNELVLTGGHLDRLEEKYKTLHAHDQQDIFLNEMKALRYLPFNEMFYRYNDYIERMAMELNKSVLPFEVLGQAVMVDPYQGERLAGTMVSLFRNAMVHGIEEPEERVHKGKDSSGKITCRLTTEGQILYIYIEDDGKGIDFNKVSKEDIFKAKVTSNEETTLLAGRGFGLSAVKDIVEELGGHINVEATLDKGTTFKMEIPLNALR